MILPLLSCSFLRGTLLICCSATKFFVSETHIWLLTTMPSGVFNDCVSTVSTVSTIDFAFWTSFWSENLVPQSLQSHRWILSSNMVYRLPSRQSFLEPHCGHRGLVPAE